MSEQDMDSSVYEEFQEPCAHIKAPTIVWLCQSASQTIWVSASKETETV
jgi:hypothetical protein